MDLNVDLIERTILPTGAFADEIKPKYLAIKHGKSIPTSWEHSSLNPRNRIDSLDPVKAPKWRIDGCCSLGTQFYTVPIFILGLAPMRIDTFIPELSTIAPEIREVLQADTAFHRQDARVSWLGISRYILRTLELWTSSIPDFKTFYTSLPFGSRILFENISTDIRQVRIRVVQTYALERKLLSLAQLKSLWGLPENSFPPTLDISEVQFIRQMHDSVSLVSVPSPGFGRDLVILKSLTSFPRWLYHELRVLLNMPTHPNIIGRPLYLITKICQFGSKRAVLGFTTRYHSGGSLQDAVPLLRAQGKLELAMQFKWALQLTSALIHVRENARTFYSDLRMENLVLSQPGNDIVMVDFEQRGVWAQFPAPEISYLDAIYSLANSTVIPVRAQEKYKQLTKRYMGDTVPALSESYHNPEQGYCAPWIAMAREEQEAGMAYMLARVLWCIFEGLSCPEQPVWCSYEWEADLEFMEFRRSPVGVMRLIDECTKGRKELEDRFPAARKGNRFVLMQGRWRSGVLDEDCVGEGTVNEVRDEAMRWWKKELSDAEEFLEKREKGELNGRWKEYLKRPKLKDILVCLERLRSQLCT
jgi:hypothetical protein